MLFLVTDDEELLRAAALMLLYVEPVLAPKAPRHLIAQQLLALALQEGRIGSTTWVEWLGGLDLGGRMPEIAEWLVANGHLDSDSGMLVVGPKAERRYGRRNFLDVLSVFTADPQFTILSGRDELGAVDLMVLTRKVEGPRLLSLGGRSWRVTHVDWKRRTAYVEASTQRAVSRWSGSSQPLSWALTDAMRRVLLGATLDGVRLSERARRQIAATRGEHSGVVDTSGSVIADWDSGQARWWTWAGARANGVVAAALAAVEPGLVDELDRYDNRYVKLRGDATAGAVRAALTAAVERFGPSLLGVELAVSDEAVRQLKFGEMLPPGLAAATLADRARDDEGVARLVLRGVR